MNNYTCKDIQKLLPNYIDNSLSQEDISVIKLHLELCDECFQKYSVLKNIADRIDKAFSDINSKDFAMEKLFFEHNIGAYIDNELDTLDAYAVNYFASKSKTARQEIDDLIRFEENLKLNIENNKQLLQNDLSHKVIEKFKRDVESKIFVKAALITAIFILLTVFAGLVSVYDGLSKIQAFVSHF